MERSDCGGFYKPVMPIDVALRSAASSLAIKRDIVALVLSSYGSDRLTVDEIKKCLDKIVREPLIEEASRACGCLTTLNEQRKDAVLRLQFAEHELEQFRKNCDQRLRAEFACTQFDGLAPYLEDMDMNASVSTLSTEPLNESQHNPHASPQDRALPNTSPPPPIINENEYRKTNVFKLEQERKQKLKKVIAAYKERVYFFDTLLKPTNEIASEKIFAPLFLYAFSHSRNVQRIVCAEFCNARPPGVRQLHPSRHYTFIACLPTLYEHYYMGNITRDAMIILARHLHAYGFVPLLKQSDVDMALIQ